MVALLFIPNPMNYPVVNHIDHNGLNNDVSNLEWCTQKHNVHHSMHLMRHPKKSAAGVTGEKYITKGRKGKFLVSIRLADLKFSKTVDSIEEAKAIRDELLKEAGYAL